MSSFALVLSSSLLVLTDSVEILTYTTSNPAPVLPSFVNCSDPTGCEINCNGDYSCYNTVVYCPDNATCTVTATGSEAVSIMLVYCGTNGICDITGRGDKSLFYVAVYAETSTKLTVTADGGYRSFHCDIYCPRNQPQPSCFARVRSDSSPYFTSDYVMRNSSLSIYVDSINDIEFQCDANTDWAALFEPGSDNSIFYYSNTNDPVCTWKPDPNYAQNDFFNTNSFICLDGYDTNIMNNKRCVPWDTDTVTSTEPTQLPSKLPTQLPTKLPTQLPSKTETTPPSAIPTKPPSTTSTLPTEFPTIVLFTSSTKVPSEEYRTTATIKNVSSSSIYSIVIVSSICVCIASIGCILGVIFYRKRVKQKEMDINAGMHDLHTVDDENVEDIYHDEGEEKANNNNELKRTIEGDKMDIGDDLGNDDKNVGVKQFVTLTQGMRHNDSNNDDLLENPPQAEGVEEADQATDYTSNEAPIITDGFYDV